MTSHPNTFHITHSPVTVLDRVCVFVRDDSLRVDRLKETQLTESFRAERVSFDQTDSLPAAGAEKHQILPSQTVMTSRTSQQENTIKKTMSRTDAHTQETPGTLYQPQYTAVAKAMLRNICF